MSILANKSADCHRDGKHDHDHESGAHTARRRVLDPRRRRRQARSHELGLVPLACLPPLRVAVLNQRAAAATAADWDSARLERSFRNGAAAAVPLRRGEL